MATKYAVKDGDWSGTTVWGTQLTGTLDFTNGSSSVSGTGTAFSTELAANDYILGADGSWYQVSSIASDTSLTLTSNYAGTTSTGNTSYKQVTYPVEGDNAVINSGVTVSLDNESGTVTVGDDTGDALTIYGTLQYTSSASNDVTLRLKGHGKVNNGGSFLVGTSTNKISSTTFTLDLNYSASLSSEKYTFYVYDGGKIALYGSYPSQWKTYMTASASAGATSITVNDSVSWSSGDSVLFMHRAYHANDTTNRCEKKTISSVAGTTITFTAGLDYDQEDETVVLLCDRNIIIKAYNSNYTAKLYINQDNSVDNAYFYGVEHNYMKIHTRQAAYRKCYYYAEGCYFDNCNHYDDYVRTKRELKNCIFDIAHFSGNGEKVWYFDTCYFAHKTGDFRYCDFYCKNCEFAQGHYTSYNYGYFRAGFAYLENCKLYGYDDSNHGYSYFYDSCKFVLINTEIFNCNRIANSNSYGYIDNCNFHDIADTPNIYFYENAFSFVKDTTISSWSRESGGDYPVVLLSDGVVYWDKGSYGNSSYYSITGRTGDCLVIDPSSTTDYLYVKDYMGYALLKNIYLGEGYSLDYNDYITTLLDEGEFNYFTSFPVNSGKTISLSFYVKTSTSGFNGELQISAEGCGISYSWTTVTLSDSWTQQTFSLGTTTDSGFVRLKLRAKDGSTTGDIYLDDFAITES